MTRSMSCSTSRMASPSAAQGSEDRGKPSRLLGTLARCRLVEKQDLGTDGQRPGQLDQPPGAGRQRVGPGLGDVLEPDAAQELLA